MTRNLGINFISPDRWGDYQLPAFRAMAPTCAKLNMFYDGSVNPVFGSSEMDNILDSGVQDVIIRTSETRITTGEIETQLHAPMRGWNRSLFDYIQTHPNVHFHVEVGNEPDLAGVNPWIHRYYMLRVAQLVAPKYRQSHPNLSWIASLSTLEGGADYWNTLMSGPHGDSVPSLYDSLGVHVYGYNTLFRSDGHSPWAVADWVFGYCDKPIWVTEAGIDAPMLWSDKAKLYLDGVAEAGRHYGDRLRGVTFFTYSTDAQWYDTTHYSIDVDPTGKLDPTFSASKRLANR